MQAIETIGYVVATMYIGLVFGFLMITCAMEGGLTLRAISGALILPFVFWMPTKWLQRGRPYGG